MIAGASKDGDDDLLIDIEDVVEDFAPQKDEEVADAKVQAPVASTVPDDLEENFEEIVDDPAPDAKGKQPEEAIEAAEVDLDTQMHDRAIQAEMAAREAQARSIVVQAESQANVVRQQAANAQLALNTLSDRIDQSYNALAQARDNGDTATEIAIQRNLAEMQELQRQIQQAQSQLGNPDTIINQGYEQARGLLNAPVGGVQVGSGIQALMPIAAKWASANAWMKSDANANRFVIEESTKMTRGGHDPNSPGFYAELSRRVKSAFPQLQVKTIASKRAPSTNGQRGPVAPTRASAVAGGRERQTSVGRYRLTAADQATMRRFNLDPTNKAHQREWARTRISSSREA